MMDKEALVMQSSPTIQGLASELIATTPEHWNSFYVDVQVESGLQAEEDLKITIKSNDSNDDLVVTTDELNEFIFTLLDFFRVSYRISSFRCDVFLKEDGKWSYETDFKFF